MGGLGGHQYLKIPLDGLSVIFGNAERKVGSPAIGGTRVCGNHMRPVLDTVQNFLSPNPDSKLANRNQHIHRFYYSVGKRHLRILISCGPVKIEASGTF